MTHTTRRPPSGGSSRGFAAFDLHACSELQPLRAKHDASILSPDEPRLSHQESRHLLKLGNVEHVARLRELCISPSFRHNSLIQGSADYLVIACSDARVLRMDSENASLQGIQMRVAGNVMPSLGTTSFDDVRDAVKLVKDNGVILIEGHCHCGAVKERTKWAEGGMKSTGSDALDRLLTEVCGTSPAQNGLEQFVKAKDTLQIGRRELSFLIYDWENGGIETPSQATVEKLRPYVASLELAKRLNGLHATAMKEGGLGRLKTHRPHSIVIGTLDMPYSAATVFHARQNELFCITGSERGLDHVDTASALYAVNHLGVHHIVFLAPGPESDLPRIGRLFERWKSDLSNMLVNGTRALGGMLSTGLLRISQFRYDLQTGKAVEFKL